MRFHGASLHTRWSRSAEAVLLDPASGSIAHLPPFPLSATERPPGPLHFDGAFLITSGLEGALFDASDRQWTSIRLPGIGTDVDMVWTDEELLSWAKCCYGPDEIDAWRWAPSG
jgi:hypothetical protein